MGAGDELYLLKHNLMQGSKISPRLQLRSGCFGLDIFRNLCYNKGIRLVFYPDKKEVVVLPEYNAKECGHCNILTFKPRAANVQPRKKAGQKCRTVDLAAYREVRRLYDEDQDLFWYLDGRAISAYAPMPNQAAAALTERGLLTKDGCIPKEVRSAVLRVASQKTTRVAGG